MFKKILQVKTNLPNTTLYMHIMIPNQNDNLYYFT